MAGRRVYRAAVLVILFTLQLQGQKNLSDKKKCGDPLCESMMIRVSAKQDYTAPDCRFLSFKTGEEINVYYKLTGEREDLWQGSKGKAYGFFPKDTVNIEEVYMVEEVEMPAQEIDFICLNGGEYFFENEDSILHRSKEYEEDPILMEEKKSIEGGVLTGDSQVDIVPQDSEQEVPDKSTWAPSGIAGWFGIRRAHDQQDTETDEKPIEVDAFLTRKLAVDEEVESKELEDSQPEKSGWFGGRLKKLLPFGERKTEAEPQDEDSDTLMPSKNIVIETDGEKTSTHTQETDQEKINEANDNGKSQPKWFNFAIKDVLGFGNKDELKKEEFLQSGDETGSKTTPTNLNPTHDESMDKNGEGEKAEVSVMDHPSVDETKDSHLYPEIHIEDITVKSGPEQGGSDEHKKDRSDVTFRLHDQQTVSRISEKKDIKNTENSKSQDHATIKNKHVTHRFKSVVSNVLKLGNGDSVKISEKDQVQFGGIDHDIQSSETPVNDHDSEPAELGHSREDPPKTDIINLKEIDGPATYPADAPMVKDCTLQEDSEHEETSRTTEKLQTELEEDPTDSVEDISSFKDKISLEDDISLPSHQQIGMPESSAMEQVTLNVDPAQEVVEETDEELNSQALEGSVERKDSTMFSGRNTNAGQDFMKHDLNSDAELRLDGHHFLASRSIDAAEIHEKQQDGPMNTGVETHVLSTTHNNETSSYKVETDTQEHPVDSTDTHFGTAFTKSRGSENSENLLTDIESNRNEMEVASQCESIEADCTFKQTSDLPWRKPQEENYEASTQIPSDSSMLPSAEILKMIFSVCLEVHSNFVDPAWSVVTDSIYKMGDVLFCGFQNLRSSGCSGLESPECNIVMFKETIIVQSSPFLCVVHPIGRAHRENGERSPQTWTQRDRSVRSLVFNQSSVRRKGPCQCDLRPLGREQGKPFLSRHITGLTQPQRVIISRPRDSKPAATNELHYGYMRAPAGAGPGQPPMLQSPVAVSVTDNLICRHQL